MQPLPLLTVVFYRTDNGAEPVRQWLREFPAEDRKSIGMDIKTVQYGWPLGMPLVRKMGKNLWEVRCNISNGIARILFTTMDKYMVLLHGFVKKTQRTPASDLKIAQIRLKKVRNAS